jgi:putative restriction endonuclease
VYIWTLTHGGGAARPKNEYRIQLTGVAPPLALNPTGPTILIGYEPNTRCFAGFDLSRHKRFSVNSPSIQISITALHDALQHGFSFTKKGNDEIAIGFRPDQFLAYALNADLLHSRGADAKTIGLLEKAASLQSIKSSELQTLAKDRQRVVATVSRLSRDSDFRRKVTIAYDRRCAVTRIQLRLIDAAHILPVGATGSNDEVYNGICLSPTYHRAFDRSLIYLDEKLRMRINPAQESELVRLGLNGGLGDFKSYLDKRIHLPADQRQWPQPDLIRSANKFRRIP